MLLFVIGNIPWKTSFKNLGQVLSSTPACPGFSTTESRTFTHKRKNGGLLCKL